ncbi:hypothetical protein SAMN05421831_11444 [Allopseudospirillum japonicum]|uniref:Restriction endonuclease n=1 Tax=Allopseudospirillum japonicum TaxID=64971 RepID=A0A1H6UHR4_9GAMM|nr:hypothetical protein [Allopseudospirillum japonicum]SEI87332.1 hypothetical protein SAMN05421831_11444 [Allopseudospirillum japonicum]
MANNNASSGHKLGQLVGDWFEEHFVFPLLQTVGEKLNLFVDSRFVERTARAGKILWNDIDGNAVDYDAVLELGGTSETRGVPVAFIECFWRRGSRHSKDKARDDSGKLLPMKDTYPTARFLGIVSAGDFTNPARELVRTRGIDLFYIPKAKIVQAFADCGLVVDYPDKLAEEQKSELVNNFENGFTPEKKIEVKNKLHDLVGITAINGYVDRVRSTLSALPQEIRFILRHDSQPISFESVVEASEFLESPSFKMDSPIETYIYEVTYTDGSEFIKEVDTLEELRSLHDEIQLLEKHMRELLV